MAGAIAGAAWSATAVAQDGTVDRQCVAGTASERATQDACQKTVDLFQYMSPQLSAALVGGNAVLGEHTTTRGPGHLSVGLRLNGFRARLPRVDQILPSIAGAQQASYATRDQLVAAPVLDAALGLFGGIAMAGTRALAVDALVNVAYLPSVSEPDIKVSLPNGNTKFGFGARLAVLLETFATPGVTVTYLRRSLPSIDLTATASSDQLSVKDLWVKTSAWRGVVGKNFASLGLSAGYGIERYETSAMVSVQVNRGGQSFSTGPISVAQDMDRRTLFADASLNLGLVRVVGEIGRVSGGSLATYNGFTNSRADDAIAYASVGLRLVW